MKADRPALDWPGRIILTACILSGLYGVLLLVLSWLHIDPCSLHLKHRRHEH